MGKTGYIIIFIFIVVVLIPLIIIKGLFFMPGREVTPRIINVYLHQENRIEKMELTEYLKGVVAAEMPAAYNMEALKAQAVAARTYTLRHLPAYGGSGCSKHPDADICTDYRHCQAWLTEEEMKERWGFLSFFYFWSRISRAVEGTAREVMVFDNKLIEAVYHSNSGGQTEGAELVWDKKVPYLKSVKSPYDDLHQKNYYHEYEFPVSKFDNLLGTEISGKLETTSDEQELISAEEKEELISILERSNSGRVQKVRIDGQTYTGKEVRSKLSLAATNFEPRIELNKIVFTVKGNGHGVGMSQDGADGFGKNDYDYRQILKHYYQGVDVIKVKK